MRRWSLITAVLLLSSVWVIAQSTTRPTAPDNSQSKQPTSAQQPDAAQEKAPAAADRSAQSIQGCITKVGAGYTLTDNSGKTYQLAGDTSKLADEVGHLDQVWGKEESSTAGAAASSGAPSTFTVTKVKVVSTTCPSK